MSRQEQRAGEGSMQVQAAGDVHIGLSTGDVVEIIHHAIRRVIGEVSSVAEQVAEQRVRSLGDRIIETFRTRPELFGAFGDPDFQFALSDAGRAAASNDDEHTERLLADLLAHRAESGSTSRTRLTTSQAIRAADKLSADALVGITALWSIPKLSGAPPTLPNHLTAAEIVATHLIPLGLPEGQGWLEEADALGLLRLHDRDTRSIKPYRELMYEKAVAELVAGFDPVASEPLVTTVRSAFPELIDQCLPHQLKTGFVRLPGNNRDELLAALPGGEANADLEQLVSQNGYGGRDPEALAELDRRISALPNAATVARWWEALTPAGLTLVGEVVAFVNARRCLDFTGPTTVSELLHLRFGGQS